MNFIKSNTTRRLSYSKEYEMFLSRRRYTPKSGILFENRMRDVGGMSSRRS